MRKRRERRRHRRLMQKERLFIQIIESDRVPALRGKTIYCSSVDVSSSGLQIEIDREAPPGCVLDMWVEIKGRRGRFYLSGEVRWCSADERRRKFQIGIELTERDATQEQEWAALFAEIDGKHERPE